MSSREQKYAEAMHAQECGCPLQSCEDDGLRLAEACIPVVEAELRAATDIYVASIADWKARAEKAEAELAEAATQELTWQTEAEENHRRALAAEAKVDIAGAAFDIEFKRRKAAEAERDDLRRQVAAVRALCDAEDARVAEANARYAAEGKILPKTGTVFRIAPILSGAEVRAALSSGAADATEGADPAASECGWRCERCGSTRWVGVAPGGPDWPRKAQCVPCGAVQGLPAASEGIKRPKPTPDPSRGRP